MVFSTNVLLPGSRALFGARPEVGIGLPFEDMGRSSARSASKGSGVR